jgi:hypothetical protein
MNRSYRILRSALCPVGVLLRLQIRFENRLQHQHDRRLYNTVCDRWYPQGPQLPIGFRNPDTFDRFRPVIFLLQPFRQFPEPALFSTGFNIFESYSVHPRRTFIGFAASVGVLNHVPSI